MLSDWLGEIEDKGWFFVSDLASIIRGFCTNLSLLSVLAAVLIAVSGVACSGGPGWACGCGPSARRRTPRNRWASTSIWYKYIAVMISGALAGLAGAFLVVGLKFQDGQTGGRGFIGLAAMIFGNWRPGGMAMGAGLFGYTDGVQQYDSSGTAMHAFLILVALALIAVAILQYRSGHPDRRRGRRRHRGALPVVVLGHRRAAAAAGQGRAVRDHPAGDGAGVAEPADAQGRRADLPQGRSLMGGAQTVDWDCCGRLAVEAAGRRLLPVLPPAGRAPRRWSTTAG